MTENSEQYKECLDSIKQRSIELAKYHSSKKIELEITANSKIESARINVKEKDL
jgi:hypothetical protein